MITVLFVAAIVAAVLSFGLRRWRKARLRRAALSGPGAMPESAIPIRSFAEMDSHLSRRRCACGGFLSLAGEGSREAGGRRLRVARMSCFDCEESREIYFDTTELLQ